MTKFKVLTNHPLALGSNDHLFPHGTMRDDSRSPEFNDKLSAVMAAKQVSPEETLLPHKRGNSAHPGYVLSILDIGCAGGGMVQDFVELGWDAIGIDGSDYSQKICRASWGVIPDNLFTADATKPFSVALYFGETQEFTGDPFHFDVITAWEVIEHIKEDDLPQFFDNILSHLGSGSLFICSVANYAYIEEGIVYHETVKPIEWWEEKIPSFGFIRRTDLEDIFNPSSWVRHSNNVPNEYGDWSKCFIFNKKVD